MLMTKIMYKFLFLFLFLFFFNELQGCMSTLNIKLVTS